MTKQEFGVLIKEGASAILEDASELPSLYPDQMGASSANVLYPQFKYNNEEARESLLVTYRQIGGTALTPYSVEASFGTGAIRQGRELIAQVSLTDGSVSIQPDQFKNQRHVLRDGSTPKGVIYKDLQSASRILDVVKSIFEGLISEQRAS